MRKAAGLLVAALVLDTIAAGQVKPPAASSDLDRFMAAVLTRRDENWKKLQQYVLDEREQMSIRGGGGVVPVWGEVREYTWYLRDGFFVRSPVKVNGAAVPEADRRKYESDFLRRAKRRDGDGDRASVSERGEARGEAAGSDSDVQALIRQTRRPQFIDSAYFLKFRFEPSRYAFVGREPFEGRDVLRIEYYPAQLFRHEQEQQQRRREQGGANAERDRATEVERLANRVALVTLWVEPSSHQIVKYTLDNVTLDFLPAAWLVHLDHARAMMTMGEPFPGVWLPRDVDMQVGATLAAGAFDVRYHVDYSNYRQAETDSRFRMSGEGR